MLYLTAPPTSEAFDSLEDWATKTIDRDIKALRAGEKEIKPMESVKPIPELHEDQKAAVAKRLDQMAAGKGLSIAAPNHTTWAEN